MLFASTAIEQNWTWIKSSAFSRAEYNKEKIPWCCLQNNITENRIAKFLASGKIVCTGAKSIADVEHRPSKVLRN